MSFSYKKRKNGKQYLYFKAGGKGPYYIAPKDSPASVNVDNVEKALQYMQSRMRKDREIYEKLVNLLPKELRGRYK